tara:strand:+ start:31 stop:1101 length:1071 start_codon:yes stop_codon:yes gene_type:complete
MLKDNGVSCTVRPVQNKKNQLTPDEGFETYSEIRTFMEEGKRHPSCKVCWDQEDETGFSFRTNLEKIDKDSKKFIIDINIGNECNLACRMCGPGLSKRLYKDLEFVKNNDLSVQAKWSTDDFLTQNIEYDSTSSIQWKWISKNYDKIGALKLAGGEPLFDKKVKNLLIDMVNSGASSNINLGFYTNGLLLSKNLKILNEFKGIYLDLSVDATDSLYEYIRYPGNFGKLEKSVNTFLHNSKNLKDFKVNFVLSSLNILNLSELLNWIKKINANDFGYIDVFPENRGINAKHLPIYLLTDAIRKIDDDKVINRIMMLIEKSIPDKKKMKTEIEIFDNSRNQSYMNVLNNDLIKWLNHD